MISSISPCRWGSRGDNFDRFVCRIQKSSQSMGIVEQALAKLPLGPVWIDDPRFVLPEKDKVYNSIEGLMHHFKIIMEGSMCRRAKPISPSKAATESSVSIL